MNKSIYILAATTMFMAATAFTSCQSSAQKADNAQAKVEDAKADLKDAQKDANAAAQKAANAEEWKVFKEETEIKIKNNETRITDLKAKMKLSGKTLDAVYAQRIDALEQRNKDLNARLVAYDKGQSDWESFKREFNHDMDELGQAFNDLTVNNKK